MGQLLPSTFIGSVFSWQHSCDPTCIIRTEEVALNGNIQVKYQHLKTAPNYYCNTSSINKTKKAVPVGLIVVTTVIQRAAGPYYYIMLQMCAIM